MRMDAAEGGTVKLFRQKDRECWNCAAWCFFGFCKDCFRAILISFVAGLLSRALFEAFR